MKPKTVYLLLALAGLLIPSIEFVPWVAEHGLNLRLMFAELFSTRIGGFFGLDVIVSAVVLIRFVSSERKQIKTWWLPILATLLGGVSVGLPLTLYLREAARESSDTMAAQAG